MCRGWPPPSARPSSRSWWPASAPSWRACARSSRPPWWRSPSCMRRSLFYELDAHLPLLWATRPARRSPRLQLPRALQPPPGFSPNFLPLRLLLAAARPGLPPEPPRGLCPQEALRRASSVGRLVFLQSALRFRTPRRWWQPGPTLLLGRLCLLLLAPGPAEALWLHDGGIVDCIHTFLGVASISAESEYFLHE